MIKHKNIIFLCVLLLVVLFVGKASVLFYGLLFLFFVGMTSWGSFDIRLNYFTAAKCNNPAETSKKIALTFDDGPHEMTLQVLDLLQHYQAKATFFCIGNQIENHSEIFKKIIADGHEVGNHTYSHSKSFGFFSAQKVTEEIQQTDALINQFTNRKNQLFRPPFGVTNPNVAKAIAKLKHEVIGWDIRSLDTVITDEAVILNRIKKRMHPGGIVLMHDTSLKTVHVLEQLLLFLQTEKYELVTVTDLLKIPTHEN